jgi:hypothetical protein
MEFLRAAVAVFPCFSEPLRKCVLLLARFWPHPKGRNEVENRVSGCGHGSGWQKISIEAVTSRWKNLPAFW